MLAQPLNVLRSTHPFLFVKYSGSGIVTAADGRLPLQSSNSEQGPLTDLATSHSAALQSPLILGYCCLLTVVWRSLRSYTLGSCPTFGSLMVDVGGPAPCGSATPRQLGLGCVMKLTGREQEWGSIPP